MYCDKKEITGEQLGEKVLSIAGAWRPGQKASFVNLLNQGSGNVTTK